MAPASAEAMLRTVLIGSGKITRSIFRQLDWCPIEEMKPLGRVRDSRTAMELVEEEENCLLPCVEPLRLLDILLVIGTRLADSELVRTWFCRPGPFFFRTTQHHEREARIAAIREMENLPLICLLR